MNFKKIKLDQVCLKLCSYYMPKGQLYFGVFNFASENGYIQILWKILKDFCEKFYGA